ncbi:hypothetical protein ACF3M1_01475 [Luteimonas sp. WGS1318]|uniref:hypothetical protein n=1 Tax=Luteimonas sp. WGS1318 TaxID=3366815 RepID=UPI00372D59B1
MRHLGETDVTSYGPIVEGGEYLVLGLIIIKDRIDFLVYDGVGCAIAVPSNLFCVVDLKLPLNWRALITKDSDEFNGLLAMGVSAVIGYAKLVESLSSYVDIVEGNSAAIKQLIDEVFLID